jgi:hypothetical protein
MIVIVTAFLESSRAGVRTHAERYDHLSVDVWRDRASRTCFEFTGPFALRRFAGLRLQSGKAPVGVVVIDNVERPSEN